MLINLVLSSLPILFSCLLPRTVLKKLDTLDQDFSGSDPHKS